MRIREATVHDVPAILELYNYMICHSTAVYDETPHTLEQRQAWFNDRTANQFPVLIAESNDYNLLGFASYGTFRPWQGFARTVEHAVYVQPNQQGQGVGRKLMLALIERAKSQQLHVMVAGIDANNGPSIKLHQSLGFTTAGVLREVGYKFGQWLDLQFMTLQLSLHEGIK